MTISLASPYAYTPFWPFNEQQFPCKCCPATEAMENNRWYCNQSQKEWSVVDQDFECWGDEVYAEHQKQLAAETAEERQRRLNKEAAEAALGKLAIQSYEMQQHAERMAIVGRMGVKKGEASKKIQKPCKWLYCNEAAPKSQWRKNAEGKLCAPPTSHVASECWGWEYLDPKTKTKKKPHTCPFLHPGEEGWCSQWMTDKLYQPGATATQNRFAALKGHSH